MILRKLIVASALFALAGASFAAGNAEAGKAKAQACFACHGVNGASVTPNFPKLAGQHASYIAKELHDFKNGNRKDPIMTGQAAALSNTDIDDLAAFFAAQKVSLGGAEKKFVKAGGKIYRGGIKDKKVPACMACHGPTGSGNPAAKFPHLGGQHAVYLAKAMEDFRSGKRTNDPNKMMRDIAGRMSDADIKAVAGYIQGLH